MFCLFRNEKNCNFHTRRVDLPTRWPPLTLLVCGVPCMFSFNIMLINFDYATRYHPQVSVMFFVHTTRLPTRNVGIYTIRMGWSWAAKIVIFVIDFRAHNHYRWTSPITSSHTRVLYLYNTFHVPSQTNPFTCYICNKWMGLVCWELLWLWFFLADSRDLLTRFIRVMQLAMSQSKSLNRL